MGWHRVKLPGLATRVLTSPIWAVAAGAIRRIWPLVLRLVRLANLPADVDPCHLPLSHGDRCPDLLPRSGGLAGGWQPLGRRGRGEWLRLPLRRLAGDDRGHGAGRATPRGRVHRRLADPDLGGCRLDPAPGPSADLVAALPAHKRRAVLRESPTDRLGLDPDRPILARGDWDGPQGLCLCAPGRRR